MKSKPSRPPIKSVDPGSFTGKHPSEDKQLARNKDRFQGTGRIGEEAARARCVSGLSLWRDRASRAEHSSRFPRVVILRSAATKDLPANGGGVRKPLYPPSGVEVAATQGAVPLAGGQQLWGTWFTTAGIDWRYATIPCASSGHMFG